MLSCSPQLAYDCMQALVSKLVERKELSIDEAVAYLENPAPRVQKRPFQRSWSQAEQGAGTSGSSASKEKPDKKDKGIHTHKILNACNISQRVLRIYFLEVIKIVQKL